MTTEQAERLLRVARDAVKMADKHTLRLMAAPRDVKQNLDALREIIKEIDGAV